MRITTQVSRLNFLFRHVRGFLPYLTIRKLSNAALNYVEAARKTDIPRSLPPYLKIESSPACQMSCPGCRHRDPEFKKQFNGTSHLSLEDFKRIIDPIADTTLGISISFRGEPLLNRQLPSIIAYAHRRDIATSFPTNLSMHISDKFAEEIVSSGLDTLYISLDGASAETYSKYRIGGVFDMVLSNTRLLAKTKQILGKKTPRLIWKMVIFDHNKHEIKTQKRTYRQLGFDDTEVVLDSQGAAVSNLRRRYNQKMIKSRSGCLWLWNTMVIDSQGEVYPCCTHSKFGLGNVIQSGVKTVWTSPEYRSLRIPFSAKEYGHGMNPVCSNCIGLESKQKLVEVADS